MKDRLIELIANADTYDNYNCELCEKGDDACCRCYAERLSDCLLANGVIVPPCKVGDTVYMLVTKTTTRFDFENGRMKKVVSQHTLIKETRLLKSNFFKVIETFGKTVFRTREEAEQALKERLSK